ATARYVFDDHGLTEGHSHSLCQNARKRVGAATRSKWHAERNGARRIALRRIILRPGDPPHNGQCSRAGGQLQKLSAAVESHGVFFSCSSLGPLFVYRGGTLVPITPRSLLDHSGLMFANLITFAHCGISRSMVAASSAGVLPIKSRPISSRLLRASGIAITRSVCR